MAYTTGLLSWKDRPVWHLGNPNNFPFTVSTAPEKNIWKQVFVSYTNLLKYSLRKWNSVVLCQCVMWLKWYLSHAAFSKPFSPNPAPSSEVWTIFDWWLLDWADQWNFAFNWLKGKIMPTKSVPDSFDQSFQLNSVLLATLSTFKWL